MLAVLLLSAAEGCSGQLSCGFAIMIAFQVRWCTYRWDLSYYERLDLLRDVLTEYRGPAPSGGHWDMLARCSRLTALGFTSFSGGRLTCRSLALWLRCLVSLRECARGC